MGDAPSQVLATMQNYLSGVTDALVRGFVSAMDWSMDRRALEPLSLPCMRHLADAAESAPPQTRPLTQLLADRSEELRWGQTYEASDFGPRFLDNYGWVEIFGTRGHFAIDTIAGGFLLLGPDTLYPDHHHLAEEIYIPLSGAAFWRMGSGDFIERAAGEIIHHPSNVSHAMRTGRAPLLALYLWRGGDLTQRSTITGNA